MPGSASRALIVAHGQPSAPGPAEDRLAALAARIQSQTDRVKVLSATLANPGALEQRLTEMDASSVVYPLFMTPGFFTNTVLPKRLEGYPGRVLSCLGTEPDLPGTCAAILRRNAHSEGWEAPQVLLAAHGSARGPVPAQATNAFADRLRVALAGWDIRTGFVEQSPGIDDASQGMADQSFCLPFFALEGDHVRDDVTNALQAAGFNGTLLSTLGETPEVAALIARRLEVETT